MDIAKVGAKATGLLKKYKYAVLILCIGLILMALPGTKPDKPQKQSPVAQAPQASQSTEEILSQTLSNIDGAGNVQVMLTIAKGEQTLYQTDESFNSSQDSENKKSDTVLITNDGRGQSGLVRQTIPPVYQGAIVLCQGADNPAICLAITEAVSKVTGLGADRIAVLKMK